MSLVSGNCNESWVFKHFKFCKSGNFTLSNDCTRIDFSFCGYFSIYTGVVCWTFAAVTLVETGFFKFNNTLGKNLTNEKLENQN